MHTFHWRHESVFPWFRHMGEHHHSARHYLKRMSACGSFKTKRIEDQQLGKTWANGRLQAYRGPRVSKKALTTAFKWRKTSEALSYTVVWRWGWDRANHGTEEHSEPHLLVHRLLNHSFKATQLKSGSFRVTVDGVPKALDILHKEK